MKIRLKMVGYYPFLLLLLTTIWMTAAHSQNSNTYQKQQEATESHHENQGKVSQFF